MDILLLSQDESHPAYCDISAYFSAPFSGVPADRQFDCFRNPPLGITMLASYLNPRGVSALPLHSFFSFEENNARLINALRQKPLAVGVSTTYIFSRRGLDPILDMVRRFSPGSFIVLGGPGAEWNRELRPEGTITVLGPGEGALFELMLRFKAGADFRGLPGISFWEGGELRENPAVAPPPLDELPFPDWGLYPGAPDTVYVLTSTGCSRRCGFCAFSKDPRRFKNVDRVLSEIKNNREKYGLDFFRFTDADFPADRERALAICRGVKEIRRQPGAQAGKPCTVHGLSWTCFSRADSLLDPGLAAAMKDAGCLWVFLGIESGSDKILSAMNKGTDAETQLKAVKNIKAAGLRVHANFVVGYPGETEETLEETMAFIRRAPLDTVFFSPFHIRHSGAPVWQNRLKYGLENEGGDTCWKHSTMDFKKANELTLKLMEETALTLEQPLLGIEMLFSYSGAGSGERFVENIFGHLETIRDWHRARINCNAEKEGLTVNRFFHNLNI